MKSRALVLSFLVLRLAADSTLCQVPERSESGLTLRPPEAHLDSGSVFHALTGGETQLVLSSDAPLQKLAATSSRMVGYLVVPYDVDEGGPPIAAGAFRIPVRSLKTGLERWDRALLGSRFLDAARHPEVLFTISSASSFSTPEVRGDTLTFTVEVKGRLAVKGQDVELTFPATLNLIPSRLSLYSKTFGDYAALKGEVTIDTADFGWEPSPRAAPLFGSRIHVSFHIVLSSVPPDRDIDPFIDRTLHVRRLRFDNLLQDTDDPVETYRFGNRLMVDLWDDAEGLQGLVESVLRKPGVARRNYAFALKAAHRAVELSGAKSARFLTALAQVYYERGEMDQAISWQQQALKEETGLGPRGRAAVESTLSRYLAEARAIAPEE